MIAGSKPKLVLVGNGMAAGRLVDELLGYGELPYDLIVIGDEPEGSYNRIMLSAVLAKEIDAAEIVQKNAAFYRDHGITFLAGGRVTAIDTATRTLSLADGSQLGYAELVLCTGALPARIGAAEQQLPGVGVFRTLADVKRMATAADAQCDALVVGGGLLGLEAAYGLVSRGARVTLVHRSQHLLSRQLDAPAGGLLRNVMASKGIRFALDAEVVSFQRNNARSDELGSALLSTGEAIPCSLAVIATGITPNIALAQAAGIGCGKGVLVDAQLRTDAPHISALGECCEFAGHTFGLVEPIWQQCQVLAERLGGRAQRSFCMAPVATKLKVSGVNVFSAGAYETAPHHRALVASDAQHHTYRKLLLSDNRIAGIVLFGDTRDGQFYFDLMNRGIDVSAALPGLIFGEAQCPDTLTERTALAS